MGENTSVLISVFSNLFCGLFVSVFLFRTLYCTGREGRCNPGKGEKLPPFRSFLAAPEGEEALSRFSSRFRRILRWFFPLSRADKT